MDPDGYVKIKCIATGSRSQSQVIKGLVFKQDPWSARYFFCQEKSNLKTISDMIESCPPNVILVEKSVSRDIQESILAKGMTLVFNMKLHRLDRVARCIGSPISSTELSLGQKLRQCQSFYIENFVEEHDSSNNDGKKPSKTLMFLEGCPSRLGCTIVLMGASSDRLKLIKNVIRCAVVMAYHFMLEASFLLDQTAMFSTVSPQLHAPFMLDFPTSNGFHQNEQINMMSCSVGDSSIPFQRYDPETYLESSLSRSIQKVMDETFPLFPDSSEGIYMQKDRCTEEDLQYQPEFSDMLDHNDNNDGDRLPNKDEICAMLDSESILVLTSSRNASRAIFLISCSTEVLMLLLERCCIIICSIRASSATPVEKLPRLMFSTMHIITSSLQSKLDVFQKGNVCLEKLNESFGCGVAVVYAKMEAQNLRKRVLLSTAACDLSFGRFMQLSFSDIALFDFHSTCGHSFHKDFPYFFGLGSMVAMFKYSPVWTCSVSLPPQMMEFSASVKREFLKKEFQ